MILEFKGEYEFLSNFYPSPFEYNGIKFKTVEHFYQSMKATNVEDAYAIIKCETPAEAKKMGRKIKVRSDWEDIKVKVMKIALTEKFKEPTLRLHLIMTGTEEIVEGNYWHDTFWGKCFCKDCGNQGKNILGELLMAKRTEINLEIKRNICEK